MTRINKLTKAMDLIKFAFSLTTNEVLCVMGNMLDYVKTNYPTKAELVNTEDISCDNCDFQATSMCACIPSDDAELDAALCGNYKGAIMPPQEEKELYEQELEEAYEQEQEEYEERMREELLQNYDFDRGDVRY